MKHQTSSHKERFIIITCIFVIVFSVIGYIYIQNIPQSNKKQVSEKKSQEIYKSEPMNFMVNIPDKFQIDQKSTTLILISKGKQIVISRSASGFENIDEYILDLAKKNSYKMINKKEFIINENSAVNFYSEDIKYYYIYVEPDWVYSLQTSSPELYDDLDKIAQSFRYTP